MMTTIRFQHSLNFKISVYNAVSHNVYTFCFIYLYSYYEYLLLLNNANGDRGKRFKIFVEKRLNRTHILYTRVFKWQKNIVSRKRGILNVKCFSFSFFFRGSILQFVIYFPGSVRIRRKKNTSVDKFCIIICWLNWKKKKNATSSRRRRFFFCFIHRRTL